MLYRTRFPDSTFVVSLALAAMLGAGCPWNKLDDLAKDAPVQVLERDDDFTSATFGNTLLALPRASADDPPRIVVGGQFTTPLAVLELGAQGQINKTRIAKISTDEIEEVSDRMGNLIQAMALLSPTADGQRVLIAVPKLSYARVVVIEPNGGFDVGGRFDAQTGSVLKHFGGALAAGDLDGTGLEEWAIADDNNIFIVRNEDPANLEACAFPGPPDVTGYEATSRALTAGHFFEADGDRISFAAGLPDRYAPYGTVRLIRYDGGVDCNARTITPPAGTEERFFGRSLFAADLNGDGVDDLVVGSPGSTDNTVNRVYVYLSAGSPGSATLMETPSFVAETTDDIPAKQFGKSVAMIDLDGDGQPELVVGDPEAAYNGNLGRVHIFTQDWTTGNGGATLLTDERIIGDTAQPDTMVGADLKKMSIGLGFQVAGLSWDPAASRQELIAGASGSIFLYFLTGLSGDDLVADHDPR